LHTIRRSIQKLGVHCFRRTGSNWRKKARGLRRCIFWQRNNPCS